MSAVVPLEGKLTKMRFPANSTVHVMRKPDMDEFNVSPEVKKIWEN